MINLPLSRIDDPFVRSALNDLMDNANGIPVSNFKLLTIETTGAVTGKELYHNMGFIPLDIIVTRISGGTVTWLYDSFTKDKILFTTSGATKIRFLLGTVTQ